MFASINANLASKNHAYEQIIVNLQEAYQNATKDKELAEKRLNYLISEIKKAAFQFYQLQKKKVLSETKERKELEAQIVQSPPLNLLINK